jgi:tetratricopeptide (TPR) repeat protein
MPVAPGGDSTGARKVIRMDDTEDKDLTAGRDDAMAETAPGTNAEPVEEEADLATVQDDPEALQRLGESYLEADRNAEAIAVYTRLIELKPDDPEPLLTRLWAHMNAGDTEATRADAALLRERFPDNAEMLANLGDVNLLLDDREQALYDLDRAVTLAGDNNDLLYRVARSFAMAGEQDPALALYDRLVEWKPREVLLARGDLRRQRQDYAGALADLDRALQEPPGGEDRTFDHISTARVLIERARVHFENGDADAAAADAQAALGEVPDDPLAAHASGILAEVAIARRDAEGAFSAAEAATQQDPAYLPGWLTLASLYTAQSNWPAALETIHQAQEHNPNDLHLALTAALIQGETGDFEGALAEWTRLLTIDPDNPTALAMRGAVYLQMERPRAARADVDRALSIDPDNPTALQTRISINLRAGKIRGTLADIDRALEIGPHDTDMLLLRAQVHMDADDLLAAAADYTRLLEVDPDNPAGMTGLGNVQMIMGQYEAALRTYEAALKAAPGMGAALYNLAAAQSMLGRPAQALELLRRAANADPSIAEDAQDDPFLDPIRGLPGFAAALRGGPAPGGKGGGRKKGRR